MKSTWIIGGVVAVLVLGVGGFLLFSNNSETQNQEAIQQQAPVASTTTTPSETSTNSATQSTIKEFTIEGSSFKFVPNEIKVNAGDTVRVTFKNVGGIHDFTIKDLNVATKQIKTGEQEIVEFVAPKAGTYEFICSVGNHAAQGMTGTLIVE